MMLGALFWFLGPACPCFGGILSFEENLFNLKGVEERNMCVERNGKTTWNQQVSKKERSKDDEN